MNTVLLNTINLDDGRIIKKGSGGGVTIKNQTKSVTIAENGNTVVSYDSGYTGLEKVSVKVAIPNEEKVVDITENGTTEVVADNGFLNKVVVNTNVASGGGGSDMPVIGDGKTYLYIRIADKGRMDVPLYFSQTVANGVTIDWGDGSAAQTLSGTGNKNTTHTYADTGEYVISLNPADGCTLGLGHGSSSYCVMGKTGSSTSLAYVNMLYAVEIGGTSSISSYAFQYCMNLSNVIISEEVKSIGAYAFYYCNSLTNIVLPKSLNKLLSDAFSYCKNLKKVVLQNFKYDGSTSINVFSWCSTLSELTLGEGVDYIGNYWFGMCPSLIRVTIPNSVGQIQKSAFSNCLAMKVYDFSKHTSVPTLGGTSVFNSIPSDCKIVVPDALYDEWIAATNWSSYASYIVKASEFNA